MEAANAAASLERTESKALLPAAAALSTPVGAACHAARTMLVTLFFLRETTALMAL